MPRSEERISYLNEVVLEWTSGNREARITDLSSGGCYVDTIVAIPEGTVVSFKLNTAGGESATFTGVVAYELPGFGVGIKFSDLSSDAQGLLDRLLKNSA